jgi:tetratricopeptide (TPR) repeat protein
MRRGLCAVIGAALLLASCGEDRKPQDSGPPPPRTFTDAEYLAAFNRGVSELEQHRFPEAAATFDELARSRPGLVAPWINLAAAQLNRNVEGTHELCIAAAERATSIDPKAPQPYFLLGVLYKHLGKYPEAEARFKKALEHAPDDPATLYYLATVVLDRDPKEAERLFEKALEGQTHHQSAYYRLAGLKRQTDRESQAAQLRSVFQAFDAANTGDLMNIRYTEMGRLGEAVRHIPVAAESRPASREPRKVEFAGPSRLPARALAVVELAGKQVLACLEKDGTLAVHAWTGTAFERAKDVLPPIQATRPSLAAGDFDGDGREDLVLADPAGTKLLRSDGKAFAEVAGEPLGANQPAVGCVLADLDQDGDLDLVTWTDTSLDVFVNRRDGTFRRHETGAADTKAAFQPPPLPRAPERVRQVCATDLDRDGDPDLVIAGNLELSIWRNDRLMRFADVTERSGIRTNVQLPAPVTGFLVQDGDIIGTGGFGATIFRQHRGPFRLTFSQAQVARTRVPTSSASLGDLDCDGEDEVVLATSKGVQIRPFSAFESEEPQAPLGDAPARQVLLADLDSDLVLDVINATLDDTTVHFGRKPAQNHALEIRLKGRIFAKSMRSNMGGIGARVEVMAGSRSQVREMRSEDPTTLHFGLGRQTHADYVRIVWPDDVLQSEGWVPGGQVKVIEELQRKGSSCPILFAWNGERFECVTDFLGVGGLGFFLEPGVWAPPDPTEQVLIPRLVPKDGKLELRIHEPFEEITYLDKVTLIVIDHAPDLDVVPDERFSVNAPQPDGMLLAFDARIDPVAAKDGRGEDVLQAVLASDRKQASAVPDPRFLGYAEPTTFELDFGERLARLSGSDQLTLALDGWVEYPYSSINFAAWQAGLRLKAISIDVETKDRGFVRIHDEACYPAGMPRVMTLPLGKLPDALTGRLRLITNQELWIDRLWLFEQTTRERPVGTIGVLRPSRAELRAVGYPREYSPDGGAPRLYDYDIMDPSFPWKTMAGAYTRFGDVSELLREADDCTVIFGGGEEIALWFEVPEPPPPGRRRTYILDTTGWCKDMDPYTAFPYTVDPLPFRGMSNYPYRADESFPDGPAQRAWREKYQTRTVPGTRAR